MPPMRERLSSSRPDEEVVHDRDDEDAEKDKDFAARLADAGGEAMQKLSDLPMGKALVDGAKQLRERLDELGTRIRAIDPLEKRVTALEERLEALEKKSKPAARRKPAAKKTTTKTDRDVKAAKRSARRLRARNGRAWSGLLAVQLDPAAARVRRR